MQDDNLYTDEANQLKHKEKKMKVLKGTLVNHTVKEDLDGESRFYTTTDDSIVKGDVVVVWAHSRLSFLKVKKVLDTFEYLSAENDGIELEDVSLALNKVDTTAYNINKAFLAKKKRIEACIKERIAEGTVNKMIDEGIKGVSASKKAEIKALQAQLDALIADPSTALAD